MHDFSAKLTDAARRFGVREIAGALLANGETQFSQTVSTHQSRFDCDTPQPVFCLAKVMTASLVALAIKDDLISIDATLDEVLEWKSADTCRQITIAHLLGHMHGWQNAAAPEHRRDKNGFIASRAVLRDLADKPRLYEPGAMYSYDSAGYVLLGAMLEKVHRARFDHILRRHLFEPLGMKCAKAAADACPAGDGIGISLSVRDLARFVAFHLPGGADSARLLAPRVLDTPGWTPFYQGTSLAWRHGGGNWLSHEGVGFQGGPYSMVRLNPVENIGLILMSPDPRSRILGAQLFSQLSRVDLTAEFALPLSREALAAFDAEPLCGAYVNGDSHTTIHREHGKLQGSFSIGGSASVQERTLQPATRDVLFLNAPLGRRHFVQPLRTQQTSEITHLWDGYEVARRLTSS